MPDTDLQKTRILVTELPARKPYRFDLRIKADTLSEIAKTLEIVEVRKLSMRGTIKAKGRSAWELQADLGATVVQACVVTLAPVVTRIDITVRRLFTDDYGETITDEDVEMPEDDTIEPLAPEIDLLQIATESLGLALPDYPRADGAALEQSTFAAPEVAPLKDEDLKPFAGLADLKAKLENPNQK